MNGLTISWREQTFTLLPDRAAYWHDHGALLIADPHFGKAAAFRRAGVPVPEGTTGRTLDRLGSLLRHTEATRLIILGDLLHAKGSRDARVFDPIRIWRRAQASLAVTVVRGNHDLAAGDPPSDLGFELRDEPWIYQGMAMRHHPTTSGDDRVTSMAGHVHPRVSVRAKAGGRVRCRCFVFGSHGAILPAFGDFTGGARYLPDVDDRVFAIGPDTVIELRSPAATTAPGAAAHR